MTDIFDKHPRPWRVREHKLGTSYGKLIIEDADGNPIADMWHEAEIDLAGAIVAAVNATK